MNRSRSVSLVAPVLPAVVAGSIAVGLAWRRWIDPLADSGREFDVPARIAAGERLLHEIPHYFYGPLWPWLGGVFVRLFGRHFAALEIPAGVAAASIVIGLYLAVHRCAGAPAAAIASALAAAIALAAFTPAALMFPYSVSNTFALASGFFALATIGRPRGAAVAAVSLIAMILARPETGLALASAVVLAGARAEDRTLRGRFAVPALFAAAAACAIYLVEFRGIPFEELRKRSPLVLLRPNPVLRRFFLDNAGLLDPSATLRAFAVALPAVAAGLAALALVSCRRFVPRVSPRTRLLAVALAATIGAAIRIVTQSNDSLGDTSLIFVAVPLLSAITALWLLARGPVPTRDLVPFLILAFAAASSVRVFFGLRLAWLTGYSAFAFPPVAAAAAVMLLALWRPAFLDRDLFGRALAIVAAAVILVQLSWLALFRREVEGRFIETPAGSVWLTASRAAAFECLITEIAVRSFPGDGLVALPEGGFFNFVTGLPNPLGESTVMPGSLRPDSEAALARRLETAGPRFAVLENRPTPEYEQMFFGVDYAESIFAALGRAYRPASSCGPAAADAPVGSPQFFLRLYERTPARALPEQAR